MAKDFIGRTFGRTTNGGNVTLTLDSGLEGGSGTAVSEGDIVFVHGACGSGDAGPTFPVGWTEVSNGLNSNSDRRSVLAFKVMTATPDTSVEFTGDANASSSVYASAAVFSGAAYDSSAGPAVATGDSTNPDPAALTPSQADSAIVVFAMSENADISKAVSSGYTELLDGSDSIAGGDVNDVGTYIEWQDGLAASSQNPAAIGTWGTGSWRVVTIALNNVSADAEFSLSKTLGTLTSSAASSVDIDASLSKTLGALTCSAVFEATTPGDCALDVTLGALTVSGSATVDIDATLSKTTGSLTSSSAATVTIEATLSKTLGALSLSSEIEVLQDAEFALSATLGSLTGSAAATVDIEASASPTLGTLTSGANANVDIDASLSVTLGALTLSAQASGQADFAATITLGSLMSSGVIFKWDTASPADVDWSEQSGSSQTWAPQSGTSGSWSTQSGSSPTWTPQSGSSGNWSVQ